MRRCVVEGYGKNIALHTTFAEYVHRAQTNSGNHWGGQVSLVRVAVYYRTSTSVPPRYPLLTSPRRQNYQKSDAAPQTHLPHSLVIQFLDWAGPSPEAQLPLAGIAARFAYTKRGWTQEEGPHLNLKRMIADE